MSFSFINPYNFVPLGKPAHEDILPWQKKENREGSEDSGKLTGKIEYTLTTLTPLFIPNTSNDRVFSKSDRLLDGSSKDSPVYHKSFEFFSYRDLTSKKDLDQEGGFEDYLPVIPGSEMRGAVRSAYEALTDSCLSAIDLDAVLSKRTPEYFTPGILEWGEEGNSWDLYCITNKTDYLYRKNNRDDFSFKTFKNLDIPDGVEVTFIKDSIHAPDRERNARQAKPLATDVRMKKSSSPLLRGRLSGYLVKGESGPELGKPPRPKCEDCPPATKNRCDNEGAEHCYLAEKHCAHIFIKPKFVFRNFSETMTTVYARQIDQVLKIYMENKKTPHEGYAEYAKTWKEFKEHRRKGIPVYFSEIDDAHFFFSPACITREVYLNTMKDIIGNYAPCSNTTKCVCPACRLFGTIHSGLHIRSRIRFSDLHLDVKALTDSSSPVFREVVTLPELSTPKITSTEFYLQKPTADNILNWTYDYYVSLNGTSPEVKTYMPVLSGRKFYWHSNAAEEIVFKQQNNIEVTERNKTVRPVREHISFRGTVFFDEISEEELHEIIAILNMSTFAEDDRYAMKLGAAKPLGFGSVALKIDAVKVRTIKKEERSICWKPDVPYSFGSYDLSIFARDDIVKAFDTQILKSLEGEGAIATYPKKNISEQEGFNWFVSNRFAGRADRKNKSVDISQSVAGPQFRWQIAYQQYMQALQPKLADNPVLKTGSGQSQYRNGRSTRGDSSGADNRMYSHEDRNRRQGIGRRNALSTGETLDGTVTGHKANSQGKYMYAMIKSSYGSIRVHIRSFTPHMYGDLREIVPVGTKVKLCFKGKNSEGYDEWECRVN